jgi:homopolymeric O-antigen transport system ATP-binding protein
MLPPAIQVKGLWKRYCRSFKRGLAYSTLDILGDAIGRRVSAVPRLRKGEFWSIRDVSLEVASGECLGLIGANGAGKTTFLKLLNGIIRPDSGRIQLLGRVGALIEVGAGFHPLLSGGENIYLNGSILGMTRSELRSRYDSIIDFSGLDRSIIRSPVKTYSTGMLVRLGFAVAIHCRPDVLLIDEILAVGDMNFQAKCLNALGDIRSVGTTIVLVSHNLNHIAGWADRVIVLDEGVIVAAGRPEETLQCYVEAQDLRLREDASGGPSPRGSGRCVINSVRVLATSAAAAEGLRAGESFSIVASLDVREPLDDVEVDLKIFDGFDRLRSGASSRYLGPPLTLPSGAVMLEASFRSLPLNGGALRPSLALWRRGRSELLDWYEGTPVSIRGIPASQGDLWLPPTYSVVEAT